MEIGLVIDMDNLSSNTYPFVYSDEALKKFNEPRAWRWLDLESFDGTCSKEAISALTEAFKEDRERFYDVGNFATSSKKGKNLSKFYERACHAALGSGVPSGRRECVMTEVNCGTDEKKLFFLEWLLYASPFAPFIVNSDDFEFCSKFGVCITGATPYKLMQMLAIITRNFKECSNTSFIIFKELVTEHGVPGFIAYSIAMNSGYSRNNCGKAWKDNDFYCTSYGHRTSRPYSISAFEKAYSNIAEDENTKEYFGVPFRKKASIYGCGNLFWDKEDLEPDLYNKQKIVVKRGRGLCYLHTLMPDDIGKLLQEFRKGSTAKEGYSPPNPFIRQIHTDNTEKHITGQELVDFLLPIVKERLSNVF